MPKHAARRVVPRWFAVPDDGSQAVRKSVQQSADEEGKMKAEEILRICGFKNAAAVTAAAANNRTNVRDIKLTALAVKLINSKCHRNFDGTAGVIRDKRVTLGIKPGVVVKGTRAMAVAEALYDGNREEIYAVSNCDPREWDNGFPNYDTRRRIGW